MRHKPRQTTPAAPEPWGGSRPGAGRKPLVAGEPTEAHAVTLPAALWRAIEAAGGGNRSAGLRRLLAVLQALDN